MKKYLLIGLACVVALGVSAQHGPKDPHKAAAKQTEKMKTHLELTEAQYASVKKINTDYAKKIVAMRIEPGDNNGQLKALRQQKKTEIYAVLTPAQQERWTALKKEQKARKHRKGKHHGNHGEGRH